jgi:hypothetical protein
VDAQPLGQPLRPERLKRGGASTLALARAREAYAPAWP